VGLEKLSRTLIGGRRWISCFKAAVLMPWSSSRSQSLPCRAASEKDGAVRKIAAWVVVAAFGALTFFLYRTTHLVIDDQVSSADTYGRHTVAWTAVQKAFVVQDLASSPYNPVMKTNGSSFGPSRRLVQALQRSTAFVTAERADRALVIQAGNHLRPRSQRVDTFQAESAGT